MSSRKFVPTGPLHSLEIRRCFPFQVPFYQALLRAGGPTVRRLSLEFTYHFAYQFISNSYPTLRLDFLRALRNLILRIPIDALASRTEATQMWTNLVNILGSCPMGLVDLRFIYDCTDPYSLNIDRAIALTPVRAIMDTLRPFFTLGHIAFVILERTGAARAPPMWQQVRAVNSIWMEETLGALGPAVCEYLTV